jgi:uncharacterized protein YcbX
MTRRPACLWPAPRDDRLRRRPARDEGRRGFEAWLADLLGDEVRGPLRVVEGPGDYRFMDSRSGYVSIVNLASVRDLEAAGPAGRSAALPRQPLCRGLAGLDRERLDRPGYAVGEARAEVLKPIVRCAATHVDPVTAERDIELVKALFDHYGHMFCGIYLKVEQGGTVAEGDGVAVV